MAKDLKVGTFAGASASYVKKAVEKANADGSRYLTKAEAKALPKDLQDSYAAAQSQATNHVVTANSFVQDYAHLVTSAAERADVNGDGILQATELRHLPKELQDNAANFGGVSKPAEPSVVSEVSLPLSKANIETVRAAMVDWIEHELTPRKPAEYEEDGFEYENAEWADLVHEFGGDDEHEALKQEALELARNWTPNSDWQADTTSQGGVYFTGYFKMITMFVELETGKKPSFVTEID